MLGKGGVLYGTTQKGGSGTCAEPPQETGCGTVFRLTPPATPGGAWTETILHSFTGQNGEGSTPTGPITMNADGVLVGSTLSGGAGPGTIFAVEP